ncbi:elastin-like [Penaeus japonicus]|uniref:elastin-like n=1 Tax=Penaeus japonicus TaxID=27405 RepID=UPI001C70D8A9|nr:elastin-like [Penaeus japonicus]
MFPQRTLVKAVTVALLCCVASAQYQYSASGTVHGGGGGVQVTATGFTSGPGGVAGGIFPGGVAGGRGGGGNVVRIPPTASGIIPNYAVNINRPVSRNVIRIPKVAMHTLPAVVGGGHGKGTYA